MMVNMRGMVLLLIIANNAAFAVSGPSYKVYAAPSYSSGNYGSATETVTMTSIPVGVKFKNGAFSVKAATSYLMVKTSGTSSTTTTSGPMLGKKSGGGGGTSNAVSGLGDTWLDARMRIVEGAGPLPEVIPYGKLKLATASTGLGSGYNDYEGGVALEWTLKDKFYPFFDAGIRNVADAAGVRKAISIMDVGVSYALSGKVLLTGMFARDQTVRVTTADPLDVIFSWSYSYEPGNSVQAYLDKGLSTGSPDVAIGVGFERRF